MRSTCETIGSDLAGKHGPFPIQQTQREVTHVHEPKVAEKNTPYWWEAAPVVPLPPQPLAKKLDVAIVGAGYAGLAAGLVLAREGRSVAAFDAMNPGEGHRRETEASLAARSDRTM